MQDQSELDLLAALDRNTIQARLSDLENLIDRLRKENPDSEELKGLLAEQETLLEKLRTTDPENNFN
ncbi:MAG TPA: hypothetical protein VL306_01315 [Methylomirabilota bacterium]|nr:hypothetical protein [Methylomirabilota bacterium]